jgi:hypothetical protein
MTTTSRMLLVGVILELTLATAIIHFTLGGTLFLLNAAGYLVLAIAYVLALVLPMRSVRRLSWLPPVGLALYASVTILAYLVTGPYFMLGWATKGIELAIVMLVVGDLLFRIDDGRAARRPPTSA